MAARASSGSTRRSPRRIRSACSRGRFRRRTRTRMSFPAINFVQAVSANSNIRLSYSTTVNRPEFRELAEFEFTDVVGNRAVKGNPESGPRAHSERGRPLGDVQRRSGRRRGQRLLQVLRQADRARRHRRGEPDRHVPELRPRAETSASSSKQAASSAENFFVNANYTFVDSKITLLPEQRTVQTSLERPLAGQSKNLFNLTCGVRDARILDAAAVQLLRRPHLGRRRQSGAGHHRSRGAARSTWCSRSGFAVSASGSRWRT